MKTKTKKKELMKGKCETENKRKRKRENIKNEQLKNDNEYKKEGTEERKG